MKKLLLLFSISAFLFSCRSDDTKTKDRTTSTDSLAASTDSELYDSTAALDDKKVCDIFVNLTKWEIPSDADAEAMIAHLNCPTCDPKYNESHIKEPRNRVLDKLICEYGMLNVTIIPARYREEDVARYCEKRGIDPASDKGKVKDYKTWIVKVKSEGVTAASSYYDFTTICPPPIGCITLKN